MGAIIVLVMTNGLIRLGFGTGTNQMVLGLHAGRRRDARHPLAEEPPQGAGRGLCDADLSPHGRDAIGACPAPAAPMRSTTGSPQTEYIGLGELEGPEDVASTATITSIAARATARSSASSRPTTNARRCSPIPAASRSASPSTAPAISSPASARWDSIPSRKTGEVTQALGRDQALLDLHRRRCAAARSQRLRHRAGRADLLHRFHDALRRP